MYSGFGAHEIQICQGTRNFNFDWLKIIFGFRHRHYQVFRSSSPLRLPFLFSLSSSSSVSSRDYRVFRKEVMTTEKNSSTSSSSFFPPAIPFQSFDFQSFIPESIRNSINQFSEWRERLGLPNPGTTEGLHKEVQRDVFVTNFAFSGMKADLGRNFCSNPLFQTQHSFSAGSSQVAPWSFLSIYATDNVIPPLRRNGANR